MPLPVDRRRLRRRTLARCGALVLAATTASSALAAPTTTVVRPATPDEAYVAQYSQAVLLEATLIASDGPVQGERVEFRLHPADDVEAAFLVADPLTDAQGRATARLVLVDGSHGGQTFVAADPTADEPGRRYVVTASFVGDDDECATNAGDEAFCSSSDTLDLFLAKENVDLALQPGTETTLGDDVTLIARIVDDNGDAPLAGTAVDGTTEKPIADVEIGFYFDLDQNERPSADELLAFETTDGNGVAQHTFTVDAAIFPAGDFEAGIQLQFGDDDRYALTGASGRIIIAQGAPDPARTVVTADPEEAEADGVGRVLITAQLVDSGNNLLAADAPAFDVAFTTDLGTMVEDTLTRDVLTGHYSQELRAPETGGDATVTVVVEGVEGASATVRFVDSGCACASADARPAPAIVLLSAVVLVARRRRGART